MRMQHSALHRVHAHAPAHVQAHAHAHALVDVDVEDMEEFNTALAKTFELNALECRSALFQQLQEDLQHTGVPSASKV